MIIKEFSQFLINLNYNKIPKDVIEKTKLCFLDYLAVYKRGINESSSKIAIKSINDLFSSDSNLKANLLNSGFIRGIAAHSLDLDDGHKLAQLHPGAIVFSSALAIINDENLNISVSGEEFFEAVVGAYEIAIVLGMLVNPNHRNQGFHSTGTLGTFAAGAVASKLLKLNLKETISCFGLCGTQAAGLLESDHAGTMGKSLHVGKAVYNGILSAILAKNGFVGGESLIDGKEGLLKAMVVKTNFTNYSLSDFLNKNLGKFHISGVYLKKYPFCRHIHSSIDSSIYLKEYLATLNKDINSIDEIDVLTYKIAAEHNNSSPKNKEELKQSLPYAVAISLICGELNLDLIDELISDGLLNSSRNIISLNEKNIRVKNIQCLADKIKVIKNNSLDILSPNKRPSKVIIKLDEYCNNETFEDITYYPLGEPDNPLSFKDILKKFNMLNPDYNLDKLAILDVMENKMMGEVLEHIGIK